MDKKTLSQAATECLFWLLCGSLQLIFISQIWHFLCLNFLELCYHACHFILRPTPHKLQMQQSACLFFLSATLPFAVSCVWSPLSCWYLCLNWMRRSERVEVTRNGGFSQNLQTQHFNTSDRLRLSFYTLLLRSKTGLAVCNSFLESHQSTWSFLEIRDADFDACILYFNQAFIFMINVTKSFKK